MTRLMGYAARFANVPRAFEVLRHHPAGIDLEVLAAQLGVPEPQLREELKTFYLTDVVDTSVGIRFSAIEFLGSDGDVADADEAGRIRLAGHEPLSELGVELLDAQQLALLYRAAWELSTLEPDNTVLQRAVAQLGRRLVPTAADRPEVGGPTAALLRQAIDECRRVEIVYARTWEPGVSTRVIEPYQVLSTRRGYEIDAGAVDRGGQLRTFLVTGIRSVRLMTETFERPADVEERITASRATTAVTIVVPVDRAWVVERFSERVEPGRQDSEDVSIVAHLVPPVAQRVGLMLTIAGPGSFVVSPPDLVAADVATARQLLAHHRLG